MDQPSALQPQRFEPLRIFLDCSDVGRKIDHANFKMDQQKRLVKRVKSTFGKK